MKKLTAGIFATLLTMVSVDGAYAAIASKGYVDDQVGEVSQTVTTLSGTVSGHTTQIANKADSSTVTALAGRVDTAEDEIDTLQTEVAGKQAALGFTPENSANKTTTLSGTSTDAQYPSAKAVWDTIQTETTGIANEADVTELKGRVSTLETASANHVVKNEAITGGTHTKITYDAKGLVTAGANLTAEDIPTIPNTKVSGLGSLATKSSVATADIASQAVTKEKLATDIVTSLGKADSALQEADLADYVTKEAADAAYADIATEGVAGTASTNAQTALTNIGTLSQLTTDAKGNTVAAINEVAKEAADAATAAAGAKTAADAAQGDVDALETVVNNETTGLAAAHTAIDALESGKLDKTGTAARATADASGNVITSTYATKAEIADMATDENLALKQDKTDNTLTTTSKTVVGAINEVKTTADGANTAAGAALNEVKTTADGANTAAGAAQDAADAAQADATQALADAATAQDAAEAAQTAAETAQATADAKQDKLTGTIGGSMQPVYLNNGAITAGTALGTLATKSTVTNDVVADGALAQSKINGLATSLAAKLTTPPTTQKGEDGLYVLTYDGTDFQWEDIARTVTE